MNTANQPGSEPLKIPEQIPNPAFRPVAPPNPERRPDRKGPVKVPEKAPANRVPAFVGSFLDAITQSHSCSIPPPADRATRAGELPALDPTRRLSDWLTTWRSGYFPLRDWTFWQYSSSAVWQHPTLTDYQAYLEQQCRDFGYVRDLANAVKHAELDTKKKPSTQMVGLANTEVSGAAFQPGAFQADAFRVQTVIISETAPSQFVVFEKAADAVMIMWNSLFSINGWM